MKKTLLLFAGCLLFTAAQGQEQRRSSFIGEQAIHTDDVRPRDHGNPVTGRPSLYDYREGSTFLPNHMREAINPEEEYSGIGQRLDASVLLGVGSQELKPAGTNESYFKVGLSTTGYLVFLNKKDALGLTLDFSYEHLFNKTAYSFNFFTGPAYSHNFTPFAMTHTSLDLAVGYILRIQRVSPNVYMPEFEARHMTYQHTLGFRAGVSWLIWMDNLPVEYGVNFYMPFGPSIFMGGKDKDQTDTTFGREWSIALNLGVRFGNY